jgi:predicted nuclease of predicted toxin-antitoxin system
MTVRDQHLQGTPDENLFNVCAAEDRILITLDHDFGQVLRFPPERGAGLIILEPGAQVTPQALLDRLRDFRALAEVRSPEGTLWIVEPGRVRIHLRGDDE